MSTSYQPIVEKFIKRLRNDKQFFNYKNLSTEQIAELVKDHVVDLINQAIDMIYKYGKPDIDFYDKDDELQIINDDLINQEISLLVDIMYQKYFEEDKNKLHVFGLTFRSGELNVFSPSQDRKTFLEMVKDIEVKNIFSITDYLSRDRKTWEYKSTMSQA